MRRVLRWAAWLFGGLLGLVLLAVLAIFAISEFRLRQTYDIEVAPVVIPTDAASIEYGRHLATTWAACTECHADGLEGQVLGDDEFGVLSAPNLTSGEGGIGDVYTDEDWVRAIRHGVKSGGRANLFMFGTFNRLSDEELGAIIAWARSVPPVDNVVPAARLRPMGRLFVVLEPGFVLPASTIDHEAPPIAVPPPGPTAAYGEHIGRTLCVECHAEDLAGGFEIEGTDGVYRLSRNLTPAGDLANWTEADFFVALRTGATPSGYQLDVEAMPWDITAKLTEDELQALWLFVQALPPAQPQDG